MHHQLQQLTCLGLEFALFDLLSHSPDSTDPAQPN